MPEFLAVRRDAIRTPWPTELYFGRIDAQVNEIRDLGDDCGLSGTPELRIDAHNWFAPVIAATAFRTNEIGRADGIQAAVLDDVVKHPRIHDAPCKSYNAGTQFHGNSFKDAAANWPSAGV